MEALNELRDQERLQLLAILKKYNGRKSLFFENSLHIIINLLLTEQDIKNEKIDNVFFYMTDEINAISNKANISNDIIFFLRPYFYEIEQVFKIIENIEKIKTTNKNYLFIFIPYMTHMCEQEIYKHNVLELTIKIIIYPIYFFPLYNDVFSLEIKNLFKDYYVDNDFSNLIFCSYALMFLQYIFNGVFRNIKSLGHASHFISEQLMQLRKEIVANNFNIQTPNDCQDNLFQLLSNIQSLQDLTNLKNSKEPSVVPIKYALHKFFLSENIKKKKKKKKRLPHTSDNSYIYHDHNEKNDIKKYGTSKNYSSDEDDNSILDTNESASDLSSTNMDNQNDNPIFTSNLENSESIQCIERNEEDDAHIIAPMANKKYRNELSSSTSTYKREHIENNHFSNTRETTNPSNNRIKIENQKDSDNEQASDDALKFRRSQSALNYSNKGFEKDTKQFGNFKETKTSKPTNIFDKNTNNYSNPINNDFDFEDMSKYHSKRILNFETDESSDNSDDAHQEPDKVNSENYNNSENIKEIRDTYQQNSKIMNKEEHINSSDNDSTNKNNIDSNKINQIFSDESDININGNNFREDNKNSSNKLLSNSLKNNDNQVVKKKVSKLKNVHDKDRQNEHNNSDNDQKHKIRNPKKKKKKINKKIAYGTGIPNFMTEFDNSKFLMKKKDKEETEKQEKKEKNYLLEKIGINNFLFLLNACTKVDSCIIIDRRIDMVTPFCTPFTYEGLIDHIFCIENLQIEIPRYIIFNEGANKTDAENSKNRTPKGYTSNDLNNKKIRVKLNSSIDVLYNDIKDLNQNEVGVFLHKKASDIQQTYKEKDSLKDIGQINKFMIKFKEKHYEHNSLSRHVNIASYILNEIKTEHTFNKLKLEDEIIQLNTNTNKTILSNIVKQIQTLIYTGENLYEIYRLISLFSVITNGFNDAYINELKKDIIEQYGINELTRLNKLHISNILRYQPRQKFIWNTLKNHFNLLSNDENDISYVCNGYAPLSTRLIEYIGVFKNNMQVFPEVFSLINGPTFDIIQNAVGYEHVQVNNNEDPAESSHMSIESSTESYSDTSSDTASNITKRTNAQSHTDMDDTSSAEVSISNHSSDKDSIQSNTSEQNYDIISKKHKKFVILFYVGGISYAEIASIRKLNQTNENYNYLIFTTEIISSKRIIDSMGN
ncbi:vacuolar protein sorting-associated protein 33, putative [Plasmodium vinckei lentum]|uniref:Vacuolar protein sorting-associated protein 33, putative n=1 Tax=Plasmodium vinckei lentum TaxID=138297 RepID=A0A6V7S3Z7_PLAVN|nr:vacuolar protein sorting-associated protein 33, putative [Plasmodium vinckei lentum]